MPAFAFIEHDFRCPACESALDDVSNLHPAAFQWGFCRGQDSSWAVYHIGECLRWRSMADGSTPAWTYFRDGGGNIGDPSIGHLIVTNRSSMFSIAGEGCPNCGLRFGGAAIEVKDSHITAVFLHANDSTFMAADYHILDADGVAVPKPDWDDHPMRVVE